MHSKDLINLKEDALTPQVSYFMDRPHPSLTIFQEIHRLL